MGSPDGPDDVAVLEAEIGGDVAPYLLAREPTPGADCRIVGYSRQYQDIRGTRSIAARLSGSILVGAGRPVAAWNLRTEEPVPSGFSGSPVIDTMTGEVVGVTSLSLNAQSGAVAVATSVIDMIWPDRVHLVTHTLTVQGVGFVHVPAGRFTMGTPDRRAAELATQRRRREFTAEAPPSEVNLGAFYIARYPVTNANYAQFIAETGMPVPARREDYWSGRYSWDPVTRRPPAGLDDHPVVLVSWSQARRYCAWLGGRLPTEAEWEKAARGPARRTWPWGDDWRPDACNTADGGPGEVSPVDRYSPIGDSPYGAAGMSGNVWEWCNSIYDPYPYRTDDGREDGGAPGPRVLRGGAFEQDRFMARCATRNRADPEAYGFTVGFRPVLLEP
jgi:formylglycine-generating enzyme required for sulfatase activity